MNPSYPFADLELARCLERTEGIANAAFVESRACLYPDSGAIWQEVAGAYAMFDGAGSPLTQTFGLGLFEEVTNDHLQELEDFFTSRNASVFHEVSPIAGPHLPAKLAERGYVPVEVSNVLFRPTALPFLPSVHPDTGIRVRIINSGEARHWAATAAAGWQQEAPDLVSFIQELGEISANAKNVFCFIAERDGQPIATASLSLGEGVALLSGASTVPAGRNLGAQRALLEARLDFASDKQFPLAMIVTEPGSVSQRNAERQGFRIAYTRTKWHRQ